MALDGPQRTDSPVIRLGEFEVDPELRELRRAGVVVPMEPKPFELLVYLIRHRHRVAHRNELMRVLWPDVVVSDASLSTCIARVREALKPHDDWIQTVRKLGYRLTAEIVSAPAQPLAAVGSASLVGGRSETLGSRVPTSLDHANATGGGPRRQAAIEPTVASVERVCFVGRRRELQLVVAALDRSLAGDGGVVALVGEPGIGKTRTIDEVVRRARADGAEVLAGCCYEGEAGQAFWPWVQVLRAFAANRSAPDLDVVLGAEASDIARLTTAVSGSTPPAPWVDPAMSRTRLFDAVVTVLRRAAARQPLLIVLDDLHWADTASSTLLQILARHLAGVPLLLLTAYRELEIAHHPTMSSMLSALQREGILTTVQMPGLDLDATRELLESMAGDSVDAATSAALREVTEGNPFFIAEYWRHLVEENAVHRAAHGWVRAADAVPVKLPAGAREVIARRLRRLSPECVQVLTIAAVVGREFSHRVVSKVATASEREVIELLDQAARTAVIEESSTTAGLYRFTHELVRATLYEDMTRMRRAALHRYVGEAIEALCGGEKTRAEIADLAHHFREGAILGDPHKAIEYSMQAADDATLACAYDVAVSYLDAAVHLLPQAADGAPRRQDCELTLALAEALERAGDGERMRTEFVRAAEQARLLGAPELLARAAIGMSSPWLPEDAPAIPLLEEALAVLPERQVALRVQAQARLAQCLYMAPDTRARREELCRSARATAAGLGDAGILAEVLAGCVEALFHCDGLDQQDELTEDLYVAAEAAADQRTRLLARAWRIVNAMRRGRLRRADDHLADFSRLATELRQPRFLAHAAAFDAALLLARGQLAAAEERSMEALRLGRGLDETAASWVSWAQLYFIRREQGRFAEFLAEGTVRQPAVAPKAAAAILRSSQYAPPHVFSEIGLLAQSRDSFRSLLAIGLDQLPPEDLRNTRISALFSMADACAALDERDAAGPLYDLLLPYAEQWNVTGWGAVVISSTHLMLAGLLAAQRRWQDAEDHFVEATRRHSEEQAVCALARTYAYHARALQRRGRKADRARTVALCEHATTLAKQHGLAGVARHIRSVEEALETPSPS